MTTRFKPAADEALAPLKLLVYGPPKSGKTICVLTFAKLGKLAVIDSESGTHQYNKLATFDRIDSQSITSIAQDIADLKADAGRTYRALAIDSATILWQRIQPTKTIDKREWAIIKRQWHTFINDLAQLPIPVILTAHEHEDPDTKAITADVEKDTPYWADLVLHLKPNHAGTVEIARSMTLTPGTEIRNPSGERILAALNAKPAAAKTA